MKNSLFLLTALCSMLFLFTSCDDDWKCEKGEGSIVTEELDLDEFDSFKIEGSMNVEVRQGDSQFVEVEGYGNYIDQLKTNVSGSGWTIEMENGCYRDLDDMKVFITIPDLEKIEIEGSGDVEIVGDFDMDELDIIVDGSGNIEAFGSIKLEKLDISIEGSGDVELNGDTDEQDIKIKGSGNVKNFGLDSNDCEVRVEGSGDVEVEVADKLDIVIRGSGDVRYKGNPNVSTDIEGSGRVHDAE